MLAVFDPAGRAGGDHRQLAAVFDSLNQLVGFLYDGHVRRKVGVVHTVKAKAAQGGNHFALYVGTDVHAKRLA